MEMRKVVKKVLDATIVEQVENPEKYRIVNAWNQLL